MAHMIGHATWQHTKQLNGWLVCLTVLSCTFQAATQPAGAQQAIVLQTTVAADGTAIASTTGMQPATAQPTITPQTAAVNGTTAAATAAVTTPLPLASNPQTTITTAADASSTAGTGAATTAVAGSIRDIAADLAVLDTNTSFAMRAGALEYLTHKAAGATTPTQDAATAATKGFVVRQGTQFYHNGKPFYFVGGNAYWLVDFYTLAWGRVKIDEFLDVCQRLGLSVIRTWMFNIGLPKAFATYDARQLAGLHYVIWAAKKRGLMMVLTLGNLWNAYKGPEEFVQMATGTAEGKDILDFYRDPATRALYKLHVWGLISRVNPLTGLAPKDDPAIFGWNLLNEPRCPGCMEAAQQAIHQDWLRDMAVFLRAADPYHLISAATEGFFVEDTKTYLHFYNPGPGAQCDGEDWFEISRMPQLDYTTVHAYERHMELLPRPSGSSGDWPNWIHCDWPCYVNWFKQYIQLHAYFAGNILGKPLVVEEFGLTWWKKTPAQQRVLFQVLFDMLLDSAQTNGALAGAMFWNAAHNDTIDIDGYNVYVDRPAYTQAASAVPSPVNLPSTMMSQSQANTMTPDNATDPIPPDVVFTPDNAPALLRQQMSAQLPAQPPPAVVVAATGQQPLLPGAAAAAGTTPATTASQTAPSVALPAVAAAPSQTAATVPIGTETAPRQTANPAAAAVPQATTASVAAEAPVATAATPAAASPATPLPGSVSEVPMAQAAATVPSSGPTVTATQGQSISAATGRHLLLQRQQQHNEVAQEPFAQQQRHDSQERVQQQQKWQQPCQQQYREYHAYHHPVIHSNGGLEPLDAANQPQQQQLPQEQQRHLQQQYKEYHHVLKFYSSSGLGPADASEQPQQQEQQQKRHPRYWQYHQPLVQGATWLPADSAEQVKRSKAHAGDVLEHLAAMAAENHVPFDVMVSQYFDSHNSGAAGVDDSRTSSSTMEDIAVTKLGTPIDQMIEMSQHDGRITQQKAFKRQLLFVQDQLDPFRRAGWREACAEQAAKTWRPYKLFNVTDTITGQTRYQAALNRDNVVSIISDTTAQLPK